jgi:hypothetical protein
MACKNYFSHTGSDGSSPFDRIKAQGYVYSYAGENLFAGNGVYNDAGQAVSAWMNSPGHKQNILNPNSLKQVSVMYSMQTAPTEDISPSCSPVPDLHFFITSRQEVIKFRKMVKVLYHICRLSIPESSARGIV